MSAFETGTSAERFAAGESAATAAVGACLAKLSAAWQHRRYDELASCFDEQVVVVMPAFSGRVQGRDAVVESYREFMERATIDDYRESPPTINVWGDTAVAFYRWEMAWRDGPASHRAAGIDLFVFRRAPATGQWCAVWRTMSIEPAGAT